MRPEQTSTFNNTQVYELFFILLKYVAKDFISVALILLNVMISDSSNVASNYRTAVKNEFERLCQIAAVG
jgi:hypothetical protein